MPQPVYTLRGLCKAYRHNADFVLEIPCLDIQAGQKLAFIGPSGCGKSTTLDILAGILRPDSADTFTFAPRPGNRADKKPDTESDTKPAPHYDLMALWAQGQHNALSTLRLHHVGYVLQTGGLLPFLSVWDNILLPRRAVGLPCTHDAQGQDNVVQDIINLLELRPLLHALPARLSVGERQRVAIARALSSRPAVVLADEPTAALDPPKARLVMELFTTLTDQLGCTVIMVTHAPDIASRHGFGLIPLQSRCENGVTTVTVEAQSW